MLTRLHEALRDAGLTAITSVGGTTGVSASIVVVPPDFQATAQPIIDAFDWSQTAHDAWLNTVARTAGQTAVDDDRTPSYKVHRAVASVTIDEINSLRQWLTSFKAEVAAATNLADLKTRVAALPNLPNRTLAQAKTAIQNTIATGGVD